VSAVTAPSTRPSELVAIAETTVLVWPLALPKTMRVPPSPLNESAPPFAVEVKLQLAPAFVDRKMPNPK
jgi:hypothetical protein